VFGFSDFACCYAVPAIQTIAGAKKIIHGVSLGSLTGPWLIV
jgi:hypothetical protein